MRSAIFPSGQRSCAHHTHPHAHHPGRSPTPLDTPVALRSSPPAALTSLPVALPELPRVRVPVGVPEVVRDGHVLQAVVLGQGRCGVGQPVRLVAQPVAGAVALGRAQGARPLAEVLGVQGVPVHAILFGPAPEQEERVKTSHGGQQRSVQTYLFLCRHSE